MYLVTPPPPPPPPHTHTHTLQNKQTKLKPPPQHHKEQNLMKIYTQTFPHQHCHKQFSNILYFTLLYCIHYFTSHFSFTKTGMLKQHYKTPWMICGDCWTTNGHTIKPEALFLIKHVIVYLLTTKYTLQAPLPGTLPPNLARIGYDTGAGLISADPSTKFAPKSHAISTIHEISEESLGTKTVEST